MRAKTKRIFLATSTIGTLATGPALAEENPGIVVTGERQDIAVEKPETALRMSLTPRETPQSVSVVTREVMDDFALDSVKDVLSRTTGINVERAETDRTYYNARGFDIVNFQYDGIGQPLGYGLQYGTLDTALFERVEIVRGATGLVSTTGNPSAAVNLVRKRPGTGTSGQISVSYGSFDTWRAETDVNLALTSDGRIRARFFGAHEEGDSYLDRYSIDRTSLYGVVAADLTDRTTLTAGYSWQKDRPEGVMWGSLPLYYSDGTAIEYDRSASIGQDWTYWQTIDRSLFADLTQELGNGWNAKASALRRVQDQDEELFYVYGNPDRDTGEGIYSYPGSFSGPMRETTFDAHVGGPFRLAGREHEVLLGVNWGRAHVMQYEAYDWSTVGLSLPGGTAFDGSFARPDFPDRELAADFTVERKSAYGLLRLSLADPVKLMLGGSIADASSTGTSYGVPYDYSATRFLPFAGLTVDLSDWLSAYASYATIYNPQTELDENQQVLAPVEGKTFEAGLKGEWLGGALNASLAAYRTNQRNVAEYVGFDTDSGQYVYTGLDARSKGFEAEVSGRPLAGLNLTAGYAYVDIADENGNEVRTYIPRHTFHANATFTPQAIPALKMGASLRYQNAIRRDQGTTANGDAIVTRQDAYATVDLMTRYDVTENVSITGNVANVTGAKYLNSLQWDQSYYSAPRTWKMTLDYRF